MSQSIFIDTRGMNDQEKIVALITEISKHIEIPQKKKKAKEIREENRKTEKSHKLKKKYNRK